MLRRQRRLRTITGHPKIPRTVFRWVLLGFTVAATLMNCSASQAQRRTSDQDDISRREAQLLERIPFDGREAYQILKEICDIGPRVSGSEGMRKQQELLQGKFEALGGKVSYQEWTVKHPENGQDVQLRNMIVEWHPDRPNRVLVCCHYDTRPFPDQDPTDPFGKFIGANDGASGAALMCVLGRSMKEIKTFGVDFVLFDAEELVFDRRRDPMFVGSTYFAQEYVRNPPDHEYKFGLLIDMIGDRNLDLFIEANSLKFAPEVTRSLWRKAQQLGVREFVARTVHEVRDDHLPLNEIARIPTCDLIDFDYPAPGRNFSYWHTTQDTPDKCSALSLAKVGWVVAEWLKSCE